MTKSIEWVEDVSGCHICTSHRRTTRGYPTYPAKWFRGKDWLISRIIWTQERGEIPEGMWVLHKCDNPGCIRIDHLFLGTPVDNMWDKMVKGRCARGENHGCYKLTWE